MTPRPWAYKEGNEILDVERTLRDDNVDLHPNTENWKEVMKQT
jgi:hypothetical protein